MTAQLFGSVEYTFTLGILFNSPKKLVMKYDKNISVEVVNVETCYHRQFLVLRIFTIYFFPVALKTGIIFPFFFILGQDQIAEEGQGQDLIAGGGHGQNLIAGEGRGQDLIAGEGHGQNQNRFQAQKEGKLRRRKPQKRKWRRKKSNRSNK